MSPNVSRTINEIIAVSSTQKCKQIGRTTFLESATTICIHSQHGIAPALRPSERSMPTAEHLSRGHMWPDWIRYFSDCSLWFKLLWIYVILKIKSNGCAGVDFPAWLTRKVSLSPCKIGKTGGRLLWAIFTSAGNLDRSVSSHLSSKMYTDIASSTRFSLIVKELKNQNTNHLELACFLLRGIQYRQITGRSTYTNTSRITSNVTGLCSLVRYGHSMYASAWRMTYRLPKITNKEIWIHFPWDEWKVRMMLRPVLVYACPWVCGCST